jgi:Amt family ammonium transporter
MPPLTETQTALCIAYLSISPLAPAGLALMSTGLGRSRNAAHSMLAALCVMGAAGAAYLVMGNALHAGPGRSLVLAGKPFDWLSAGRPFFAGLTGDDPRALLNAWFGLVSVSLCALIPVGSVMERWRLGAICASSALLGALTWPLFAHWSQSGWLAQLVTAFGLGANFTDPGGAGATHVTGGLTALALIWLIGPRRGKYGHDGMPMAIPGHNVVLTLMGCLLALVGWTALTGAGALLNGNATLSDLPLAAINTLLCAAAAGLAAAALTRFRFGRTDASLTANGWTGGLVASCAGCLYVPPAAALLTGLIAGALVAFAIEIFELKLEIDDPGGTIPVHALAGIWGLLAAGMFGRFATGSGHFLAQCIGIASLLGFVLPFTYGLNLLLNRITPLRVSRDGERQGMDIHELGAGAYPEFMTHTDDFSVR